jgi:hypothetical protein
LTNLKRALLGSAALTLALIVVAVTVLAQTGPAPASRAQAGARVRFIHGSPDAPAVDVLLDGSEVFTNTGFDQITRYADVATGTYTVSVEPTGSDSEVLMRTLVVTESDYTLAAAGTLATGGRDLELLKLLDDNSEPAPGMVRGRFVHLVPGAPAPVSIAIQGEPPLFENVVYGDVTEYATVTSGSHTLQILVFGFEVATATVTVEPNSVYSFFALGRVSGTPELHVRQILDESYNHPIWLPLVMSNN